MSRPASPDQESLPPPASADAAEPHRTPNMWSEAKEDVETPDAAPDATSASSDAADTVPRPSHRLPDVLRSLPPGLVREALWLTLSHADRVALRAACRDLRALAGAQWMLDLQIGIDLRCVVIAAPPSRDQAASPAARGVRAVASRQPCSHAAAAAAAPPPHRTLHDADAFSSPRSVTIRLPRHRLRAFDAAAAGGGGTFPGRLRRQGEAFPARQGCLGGPVGAGAPPPSPPPCHDRDGAGAVQTSSLADAALLQHFNALQLGPSGAVRKNPTVSFAAAAQGASPCDAEAAGVGVGVADITFVLGGGDGGTDADDGHAVNGDFLFARLGVCRSARVVRALGLPCDLALRRPFLEPLAAAYPCAEELVVRCTAPLTAITRTAAYAPGSEAAADRGVAAAVPPLAALMPQLSRLEVALQPPQPESSGNPRSIDGYESCAVLSARVAAATLTRLLSSTEAPPLPTAAALPLQHLRSLCLGGVVLTNKLMAAVVQLTGIEKLRLHLMAGTAAVGGDDGAAVAELPGQLTALRRIRHLSVGLYGFSGRWLDAARHVAGSLSAGERGALRQQNAAALAAAAVSDIGILLPNASRAPVEAAAHSQRLRRWSDALTPPGGMTLVCLEIPQIPLEGPLLQALQRCPTLTSLSALGLGESDSRVGDLARSAYRGLALGINRLPERQRTGAGMQEQEPPPPLPAFPNEPSPPSPRPQQQHQEQEPEQGPQGPVLWKLQRLRLAYVRLGRALLGVLHTVPELRQLALGLSLAQYQMQYPSQGAAVQSSIAFASAAVQPDGDDDGGGDGGGGGQQAGEDDWRPRFLAAAAAGEAVTDASAASSGGGAWREMLSVCCRCEEVQLALVGSLDWVAAAGWLAGALGPKLSLLALRASSSYGKRRVRDADLAAVSYGLPYLKRLHLLSYDISGAGLLQLSKMPGLRDLRLDMETFLAYIPAEAVLDLAVTVAQCRRRRCGSGGGGPSSADGVNDFYTAVGTVSGQPQRQPQPHVPTPLLITATFLSEPQAEGLNTRLEARLRADGSNGGSTGTGSSSSSGGGVGKGAGIRSSSGGGSGAGSGREGPVRLEAGAGTDPWVVVRVASESPDLIDEADEEW